MQSVTDRSGARSVVKSNCHVIRMSVCRLFVCSLKDNQLKSAIKAPERQRERERDEHTEIFSLSSLIIYDF